MKDPLKIYEVLQKEYGPQGWWPLSSCKKKKGFDERGYHRREFSYPKTDAQRFEIIIGAVLTQNTSWRNVEKAMLNLEESALLDIEKIRKMKKGKLASLIRPAGYFNQKAERLIIVSKLFHDKGFAELRKQKTGELRKLLLSVKGVGPETADSMILYAFSKPSFVVDTYTRRILGRLGHDENSYEEVQQIFHSSLDPDVELFQEYHALMVEHAKQHCKTRPDCEKCPFSPKCPKRL
ncbi:MAG: endonuclease III domain-containing protein [Candidatus Nanoarchaeia archaeon]